MLRRFVPHGSRRVQDLAGVWDFAFLGAVDPEKVQPDKIVFDDRMAVPGCFDATPRYAGQRGVAAYRVPLHLAEMGRHRLYLGGVHHWGRVFLLPETGKPQHLTDHVGGFTRFAVDLPAVKPGNYDLIVLVDNTIDYDRCPLHLVYFDWYHYGGIARGAELHRLGDLWIDQLAITTTDYKSRTLKVRVQYASDATPDVAPLTITCQGQPVLSEMVSLRAASGVIEREITLPGAGLWSCEEPTLHQVRVQLGYDDMIERVGIRQVRVEGRSILLNDQPLTLLGFNRHESTAQFGHSQPWQLLVNDVQQLKDMNVNFIRGSHYPQDPRFLDLCDEAGICVWVESIGWQHNAEHLQDERFISAQLNLIGEMVAQSTNHASVIMWGLLNESHSEDRACRKGYKTLIQRIRKLDSSRPVTYACNHPWDDRCLDLIDIVSLNTYPGWYWGSIPTMPEELDKVVDHLDSQAACRDKPLIVSEIGAEALYGFRDWNHERWSEEYQAALHEATIRHLFVTRKRAIGLTLWLYNDFRAANDTKKHLGRARGYNNKGVVDEYRRPKLAYHTVKALYGQVQAAGGGTEGTPQVASTPSPPSTTKTKGRVAKKSVAKPARPAAKKPATKRAAAAKKRTK